MVRALVSVLVLGLLTTVAVAQPNPEGAKLFEEGRELAKEGKYAEACDRFSKSLELDPAVGTKLNYADCHEHLSQFAQAWRLFDEAAENDKLGNPERAKFARSRADALLPKLGVVKVKLPKHDAAGLTVTIGGRIVKPAPEIREVVDPAEITIEVTVPNAAPFKKTERVEAGATVLVDVPAPGVEIGSQSSSENTTVRRRSRVLGAYILGGAGIVSLGAGILVGISAKSSYDGEFDNGNCMPGSPPTCNADGFTAQGDAVSLANVGTVFGVVGLAAIAGGAVLFLTAPRDVVVTPTATAQSAGLTVVGRF